MSVSPCGAHFKIDRLCADMVVGVSAVLKAFKRVRAKRFSFKATVRIYFCSPCPWLLQTNSHLTHGINL